MRHFLLLSLFASAVWSASAWAAPTQEPEEFLKAFPHLEKLTYSEPDTHIRMGLGISPIMILKNKAGFSANLTEIHWIKGTWDWTVLSVSYGSTFSGDPLASINAFTFKTIPKYRVSNFLSAGLVFGFELISFPQIIVRLSKDNLESPPEPLSKRGFIFGGALSETFKLNKTFDLKLTQLIYKQTYDAEGTTQGWRYYYTPDNLNQDKSLISPGMVFVLDVSIIF